MSGSRFNHQVNSYHDGGGDNTLQKVKDRKEKRQQAEIQETLSSIQERITIALENFEMSKHLGIPLIRKSSAEVVAIEDPALLYEVLYDAKAKQTYQKAYAVIIIDYENKCEKREQILKQVSYEYIFKLYV